MQKIRLVGTWEIQQMLGVGRARTYQITSRKGFPDPYVVLKMGSVWVAEDVETWIRENRPEIAEDSES
ncbi:MAG: prophage regulatory protein, partial [Actinoplanes sp.]|jgi:predicted DNA-binding transcriptional regulator AlpA|nr:prophage regulatory protein [Actinoplanes sp.]